MKTREKFEEHRTQIETHFGGQNSRSLIRFSLAKRRSRRARRP